MRDITKEFDTRFKKFGSISFTSETKVNTFVDYLEKDVVAATHCRNCKTVFFPPRFDCCRCLDSDMVWQSVAGQGKLVSFSRLTYGPAGFETDLPYVIALVDFGDCRVFGRLDETLQIEEIHIGMSLNIQVLGLESDRWTYVFKKI